VSSSVVVSCLGRRAERALEGVQVLKLAGELTSAAVYALLATERQRAAGQVEAVVDDDVEGGDG
jgi:hypothetical protein